MHHKWGYQLFYVPEQDQQIKWYSKFVNIISFVFIKSVANIDTTISFQANQFNDIWLLFAPLSHHRLLNSAYSESLMDTPKYFITINP